MIVSNAKFSCVSGVRYSDCTTRDLVNENLNRGIWLLHFLVML
jgi:hypothetical protein